MMDKRATGMVFSAHYQFAGSSTVISSKSRMPAFGLGKMASVGFHLIGLPDVLITVVQKDDQQPSINAEQLEIAALIDDIADEMTREGVEAALAARHNTRYEEDQYKFNPFEVASIQEKKL
ncbi:hypothetical protein [Rhizobium lusitanum]|uniref:Uncharacterized protein n=1 Tax=Rhizobium lusitanum TaxID=293958 RepID=A0A1C3WDS7_9HYPH|nr:hypothetical protein GA0061101_110129 [Rhizobium lusitanum]